MDIAPRMQKIAKQLESGFSADYGFLHIGKTGGSGLADLRSSLREVSDTIPIQFGHWWTVDEIAQHYPKTKLSCIIRDPLERMISGFNSRYRKGQPRNFNPWTEGEEKAFTLFPDVSAFLDALASSDPSALANAQFAMRNITHLAWSYTHHFGSLDNAKRHSKRFYCVGHIDHMESALEGIFAPCDVRKADIEARYEKAHVSSVRSAEVLSGYSDAERIAMHAAVEDDYAIYDYLKSLSLG